MPSPVLSTPVLFRAEPRRPESGGCRTRPPPTRAVSASLPKPRPLCPASTTHPTTSETYWTTTMNGVSISLSWRESHRNGMPSAIDSFVGHSDLLPSLLGQSSGLVRAVHSLQFQRLSYPQLWWIDFTELVDSDRGQLPRQSISQLNPCRRRHASHSLFLTQTPTQSPVRPVRRSNLSDSRHNPRRWPSGQEFGLPLQFQ